MYGEVNIVYVPLVQPPRRDFEKLEANTNYSPCELTSESFTYQGRDKEVLVITGVLASYPQWGSSS